MAWQGASLVFLVKLLLLSLKNLLYRWLKSAEMFAQHWSSPYDLLLKWSIRRSVSSISRRSFTKLMGLLLLTQSSSEASWHRSEADCGVSHWETGQLCSATVKKKNVKRKLLRARTAFMFILSAQGRTIHKNIYKLIKLAHKTIWIQDNSPMCTTLNSVLSLMTVPFLLD